MSRIIKEISTKSPTGSDQKYEDTYLEIEAEIDKTMSASNAGEVDWTLISEHATQILEDKSKDLKIASYWLYAQWKLSSWEGLAFALPLYTELISTYQMKLFPKSTKVKLRILEWLHESLTIAILRSIDELDEEKFKGLLNSLEGLESTILEVFEKEDLKIFSPLIRKLKKYDDEKKSLAKLHKEIEPIVEKKKNTVESNESKEDIEADAYDLLEHKRELSEKVSTIKSSELLFEMTQLIGFSKFKEDFLEEKRLKRDEFPSNEELVYLETLKDNNGYMGQLKVYIMKYPCWLEGQYLMLVHSEVKEESEQFKIFINTLKYKLISFIKDNDVKIHNCTPPNYSIVGLELKKWINFEKKYLIISNSNSKIEQTFEEALRLIKEKGKEEGVMILDSAMRESKTDEESFLWRLKQVYLAFEIDNKQMAVALLYDLDREIESFNLERWKPSLAIEVYVLLLKPSINKILNLETKELIYGKLCRLSPKEAMKIGFL